MKCMKNLLLYSIFEVIVVVYYMSIMRVQPREQRGMLHKSFVTTSFAFLGASAIAMIASSFK